MRFYFGVVENAEVYMRFDKKQLINECLNLLRVITDKHYGINKAYSEYLRDFDSTVFLNAQVMYNKEGSVIWRSYEGIHRPNLPGTSVVDVDVAFSPGFWFGKDEASLIIWGELLPFGEEGLYSEIFINFEEPSLDEENVDEDEFRDSLFVVHSSTELISLMCTVVKEHWDWRALFDIQYTHILELLNQYIDEFVCFDLKRWGRVFENIQEDIPVRFHRGWSNESHYIKGDFDSHKTDIAINIYHCNLVDIEELKATIRHEIIHYALYRAGLPYWDDSAVFWYFATKFDAKPYKVLDADELKMLSLLNSLDECDADKTLLRLRDKIMEGIQTNC